MSNKKIITFILFIFPLFSFGQIPIIGKIIPWKPIDNNIEAFEILLTINSDTLLLKTYTNESIGKPGQYPTNLIELTSSQIYGQLKTILRYGKDGDARNWTIVEHEVRLTGREKNIVIEYHFQEYEGGQEFLSELTFKKIYKLPEDLKLIPIWDHKIESNPKYIISNNTGFLLYGQSDEGYCEGSLFRQSQNGVYQQFYTGGYNYNRIAERPLYNESELVTTIRDHRQSQDKFIITDPGQYLYTVRLGFEPYELNTEYGTKPWYSTDRAIKPDSTTPKYIKEYFELTDEFEIK